MCQALNAVESERAFLAQNKTKRKHTDTEEAFFFSAVCFFLVIRYTTTDSLYRFKLLYKVEIKSQVI